MATGYWRGADNATWDTLTNWWTTIGGTTTVGVVPGVSDTAFFNANGTTTARTVFLNAASRSLNTFSMNSNAQGNITLRGGVSGGETLQTLILGGGGVNMSTAAANAILASSVAVAFSTNNTWSIGSGRSISVDGVVSGLYKLTSNNSGIIILGNANTYSGGTDITAGVVRVGNNSALGTGTVTMTGGQLSSSSTTGYALANAFSLNAAGGSVTLTDSVNTGTLTLTGNMNVASATSVTFTSNNNVVDLQGSLTGSGALTHTAGQWWLNKTTGNTYSGAVTINGGILYLGRDTTLPNQLGGGSTLSTIDITTGSLFFGGTSAYQVDNTITSPVNASSILYGRTRNAATGLTFTGLSGFQGSVRVYATSLDGSIASQTVTMTVFPTGAANLRYQQSNTVNMTQTLKYTGTANVSSSAPIVMTAGTNTLDAVWHHAPSNGTATMAISGLVSSSTAQTHSFDIRNDSSGLLTISGGIDQQSSGVMSLKKSGTGPATISGTGTFTGSVTISAGTLNANSATALGAASSTTGISVSSAATLSLAAGTTMTYSSRNISIAGDGTSFFVGSLVLSDANTYTFGSISIASNNTFIRSTANATLAGNIANGGNTIIMGSGGTGAAAATSLTVNSVISGLGGLTFGNSSFDVLGTVILSGSNSYQGNTTFGGGTARANNNSAFGTGTLVFTGGAIDTSAPRSFSNAITVSGNITFVGTAALTLSANIALDASRTITTNGSGGALTLSGIVSGSGFSLTKAGTNTLVLSNANTYSGGTTISGGTLSISADNNLGTAAGSTLIINQAAALKVTSTFTLDPNRAVKLGLTSGSSTGIIEVDSGQTLTISGVLSNNSAGTGILGKTGTGTLFLQANNSYSGGTNITAGTIRTVAASSLGTGGVSLTTGGSLWVSRDSFFNITRLTVASLDNGQGCTIKIS